MQRTVLVFGLLSGAILSVMMAVTFPFHDAIGFDKGEIIGYTSMVLAFLLVFFGVRSYRDNVAGGSVSFGRAFSVGALIALVASLCYVATWEVIYHTSTSGSDFLPKYQAHLIEKARADGESQAQIDKRIADMQKFAKLYENPAINAALTLLEAFPVGLVFALVSAGILRRRREEGSEQIVNPRPIPG